MKAIATPRAGAGARYASIADRPGAGFGRSRLQHLECFRLTQRVAEEVVRRLAQATNEVVEMPSVRERLASVAGDRRTAGTPQSRIPRPVHAA